MIRIGYFFEHPTVSGAEGSALELFNHINRDRFSPVVFAPPDGELALRLEKSGLAVRNWKIPRGEKQEKLFSHELKGANLDILHANTMQLGRLTGRISLISGIPAISHIREFGTIKERARNNLCSNKALIAVSKAVKSNLVTQDIPAEKIHVIHNGVSQFQNFSHSPDIRCELEIPPDAPLVAWLGQITMRKDPETFTEVAAKTIERIRGVHFLFLGDVFGTSQENIDLKTSLLKAISRSPLKERVHFPGWRDDARSILAQSTALLHTALQEPLGRVLIEALATGTAIVATRVGGTPEVLGDCGVMTEPRDCTAMTEALVHLIHNPKDRQSLEKKGKSRWASLFQPEKMARKITNLWRDKKAPA